MNVVLKSLVSKNIVSTGFFAVLSAALLVSSQVHAADPVQCKGLDNDACTQQESCSWVNGYERKDGRLVSSFCRTKAKSKSTSATTTDTGEKAS